MRSMQHQSTPSPTAPDPVPPSIATHLLDLSGDILGLIHASLDQDGVPRQTMHRDAPVYLPLRREARAARAFCHTCRTLYRSPAINARISHLILELLDKGEYQYIRQEKGGEKSSKDEFDDETSSKEDELSSETSSKEDELSSEENDDGDADVADVAHAWVCKITAFPQHAILLSLCICVKQYLFRKMDYLEQLLLHILKSPAASARLETVTDLEIQSAELDVGCTTILLKLFPALAGGGKLALMGCTVCKGSLCRLSSSLHNLSLMYCTFPFESFTDIGTLTQLRSLSLEGIRMDLGCLAQLHNLSSLSIEHRGPSFSCTVLQNVHLPKLSLNNVWMLTEINFASGTLHVLELHTLKIRNFHLSLRALPSIQCLSITGIDLSGRSDELQRVHLAAVKLAKFPLTIHATFNLYGGHGCSTEQQADSILSLLPLKPFLSLHVHKLRLYYCSLDPTSIHALYSLFGSVHEIHAHSSDICFREGLLMDILQGVPSILGISITITGSKFECKVPDPRWWVTELLSVHQTKRELVFKLMDRTDQGFEKDAFFGGIFRAWQEAQRSLTGPSTVQLHIFDSYGYQRFNR
ncbi:hypothetical protein DUNSADRAFT_7747 [Dunaliella salina]|uniref:Uncharacterized protein n=1 Tax=Dunaliella salina TaxID=3046 RepID=A0ABQ7GKR9_DUNSA|nr:hypothetical protein DUNSADRAFT_7747 [Dunaliella salina]|eukprot:KAF5835205.1 hypothetical protein DUNSADRAFT_7747 [Dunaliella salina]